jgi:glycosyltransferase involved in cell wall biosynthesis
VAGEAAVYCDPFDVDDIAGAMERVHGDPGLRDRLGAAGQERAARYTWDHTAEGLWASVERVLSATH